MTASTLLHGAGLWNTDAIERQLTHVENDDVRRADARCEHLNERVKMLQWRADRFHKMKEMDTIMPAGRRSA
jgi:hypothetical protein